MSEAGGKYTRYCPGEEHIRISEAVCIGRRRANFMKCPGCQFNDDELGARRVALPTRGGVAVRPSAQTLFAEERSDPVESVFQAYDVRATYPTPLSEDVAWRVGNATAQHLRTALSGYDRSDSNMNTLVVGHDMRRSSAALTAAFIEGAVAVGTNIVDIGMIDTPQLYFAVNHMPCCGGVQTTASHNPPEYNGFKICGQKAKPVGADSGLREIRRIAKAISRHKVPALEGVVRTDLSAAYRAFLHRFLREPRPLKIVVDASNGMAGRWFPILFGGVGQFSVTPLNFEHNGDFAHPPDPLQPRSLAGLRVEVQARGADLGVCFDGDADRCVFVDERGETVRGDLLTAMLATEYLRTSPGAAVVYDVRSSRVVPEAIVRAGGVPRRERVGHVYMKRAMGSTNAIFGGEVSGHHYFRDFYGCDSGFLTFIAVANALTRSRQPLSDLVRPFRVYANSGELNFVGAEREVVLRRIAERYRDAQIDELDGVTVQYKTWWFNVRMSNTEPLLRLNLEAASPELLAEKLAEVTPLLGKPAPGPA